MAIDIGLWTFALSRSCSRTDCPPLAYLTGADLTASGITVLRYLSILSHQGQVHEEMLKPFWKLTIRWTKTSDLAEGDLTQFLHSQYMPVLVHTFSRRCDTLAIPHLGLGTDDPHVLRMYACLVLRSRSGNYAGRHCRFIKAKLCAHCNWFPHDLELGYPIKYVNRLRQNFAGLRLGGKYYWAVVIIGHTTFTLFHPKDTTKFLYVPLCIAPQTPLWP